MLSIQDIYFPLANRNRRKTHSNCGWTIPKIEQVFVPLPVLKIKYPKNRPTIDDLPNIREQVSHVYCFPRQKDIPYS